MEELGPEPCTCTAAGHSRASQIGSMPSRSLGFPPCECSPVNVRNSKFGGRCLAVELVEAGRGGDEHGRRLWHPAGGRCRRLSNTTVAETVPQHCRRTSVARCVPLCPTAPLFGLEAPGSLGLLSAFPSIMPDSCSVHWALEASELPSQPVLRAWPLLPELHCGLQCSALLAGAHTPWQRRPAARSRSWCAASAWWRTWRKWGSWTAATTGEGDGCCAL